MRQASKLFNNKKLRAAWDKDQKTWWVSVIDVIAALRETDYDSARNYWKQLKYRMSHSKNKKKKNFRSNQLKFTCKDGRLRFTDVMRYRDIIKLVQRMPAYNTAGVECFKGFVCKLAADTADMTRVFEKACVEQVFKHEVMLRTTVRKSLF